MNSSDQLRKENERLLQRLTEAEDTLRALRAGEVDAVFVESDQEQIFTLETADKPYRLLVQQMSQGAATLAVGGEVIYCNRRFADLIGSPLSALVRKPFLELVAPQSRARIEPLLQSCPSQEVQIEVLLRRADGAEVAAYLGFEGLQEGARGLCMLVTDHTEQRNYQELRSTQEALRAVSERLELAHQAGRIGTFEWDLGTGVVTWSSTEEALYGFRPGEFGGCYEAWRERLHPEDRQQAEETVQRAVAERSSFDTEFRIVRPDGEVRWLAASGKVSGGENGEPLHLLGVNVDVTDRKRALQELEEAGNKKDEFLATLAHELRNPLAPIRNAVELLQAKAPFDADLQWCSGVIDRQVQVMARLLEDLLDVSRISRMRLDLRKSRVELASVIEAAIDTSRPLIEAGDHELRIDLPDESLPLEADPMRLAQVFSNLLNNAAKYTEAGGHIRVGAEHRGEEVVVSVEDDGIGISSEMLPHVFELFSQATPSSLASQEGLGIGLSLVKGLVEMHGGSVEAHSEGPGQGSVFRVRLPVLKGAGARPEVTAPKGSGTEPTVKRRVLVVDDNRDSADSLAKLLKLPGHEVRTAYDGERSIELAESFRPDVILLDLGMPLVEGYEACRRIRQQPWGRDILVVALTGWGQDEDRRRTAEAGFDLHLVKPVNPSRLLELLAEPARAEG